jgi:hypothetical protein
MAMLSSTSLSAAPGEAATCDVRIRNNGSVVDQFTVSVVGEAGEWATIAPSTVSLFPGAEGVVTVAFVPPRASSTPTGEVPFGIRVESKEDAEGSVVEEGILAVGAFEDVFAELAPRTSRGKRRARHELALDNRGNGRVSAVLTGGDQGNDVRIAFDPPGLAAEPGTAVFSTVRVSARKRFLRGPSQTRPFTVLVEPEGGMPIALDGTFVQEPVLPRWLPRALMALLLLAALLAGLWFAFLRPEIESAAKDAVQDELAAPENRPALTPATATGSAGSSGGAESSGGAPAVRSAGTNIDGRLFLTAPGSTAFAVPDGRVLGLTDIVLQNPGGNTGTLSVQRDGTVLLVVALENFRDLDYHFVTPIVFTSGQKLELVATCSSPSCTPGLYFNGVLTEQ